MTRTFDVLIVGGGPAGLATAIAARMAGLDVVVADRARPPIDKACGEGLMPDGIAALRRLGVEVNRARGMRFRGIRFLDGALSAEAHFASCYGMGVRRTELHRLLVDRASDCGVEMLWQATVAGFSGEGVRVGSGTIRSRWVVGADGVNSQVRKWTGIQPTVTGARRIGIRQHFRIKPWTDLVEVYWARHRQAYVTPVAFDEVCVAFIAERQDITAITPLTDFPDLAVRLAGAQPVHEVRGGLSTTARWRRVAQEHVALVGEASGSVDAITGQGMALAFREAHALADALAGGNLLPYEIAHRRIVRLPGAMGRLLLFMGNNTVVRRGVLRLLAYQPVIFDKLLAFHISGPTANATV